jgi:hypothetical protein
LVDDVVEGGFDLGAAVEDVVEVEDEFGHGGILTAGEAVGTEGTGISHGWTRMNTDDYYAGRNIRKKVQAEAWR